jgi:CRP-like cAMP-binding protein
MQSIIQAISQTAKLTDKDKELIGKLFEKKEIRKNEYLLQPGKVCKDFAFIKEGLLRHAVFNDGKEQTIYFSSENDFVCDFESFISKAISKKAITALENTTIYSASYDNMQLFYNNVSTGERFGRLFLEETFIKIVNHIVSMHTDTAEQRYLNFLSSFRHLQQRIPQHYIASFVGVTPQSLSRIRRNLVKK